MADDANPYAALAEGGGAEANPYATPDAGNPYAKLWTGRSAGERATENLADATARNLTTAAVREDVSDPVGAIAPFLRPSRMPSFLPPQLRAALGVGSGIASALGIERPDVLDTAKERERREQYDLRSAADPFYKAPGGVVGKAVAGLSTLGGQLAGALTDPLNYASMGRTALQRIGAQVGANVAADAGTQLTDIGGGVQDNYNPYQTLVAGALAVPIAGAGELAPHAARAAGAKLQDVRDAAELKRVRAAAAEREAQAAAAVAQPWTIQSLWPRVEHQESRGRQDATSPAGARGVGQLMPDTARWWAGQLGHPEYGELALENSPRGEAANRFLGQTYLARQMQDFGNDPVLALAAYNAGPGRVQRWLKAFGHPDEMGRAKWVEMIPLSETRDYVRTILGDAAGGEARLSPDETRMRYDAGQEDKVEAKATEIAKAQEKERDRQAVEEIKKAAEEAQSKAQAQQAATVEDIAGNMGNRSAEIEQELTGRPSNEGEKIDMAPRVDPQVLRDAGWTESEIREYQANPGGALDRMAGQAAQGYAYHGDWSPFTPENADRQRADVAREIAKYQERIARVKGEYGPGDTVPPQVGDARPMRYEDWVRDEEQRLAQWQERGAAIERNVGRWQAANPQPEIDAEAAKVATEGGLPPIPRNLHPRQAEDARMMLYLAQDGDREMLAEAVADARRSGDALVANYGDELLKAMGEPEPRVEEPEAPERDLTDDALDIIRSGKRVQAGEGPSLAEALVKAGGVRDEGGELTHIMGGRGEDRFWKMLRRAKAGMALDDATLWAWERGYIGQPNGERPHISELLNALSEEAAGRKRHASYDPERQAMAERVDAIEEMLGYLGIDPHSMSNAEIKRAMDEFMESAAFDERPREDVLDEDVFGAKGKREHDQGDMFAPDETQKAGQLAADLERMIRERQAKRGAEPMAEGSLFDEVRRGEQDLFGMGGRAAGDDGALKAMQAAKRLRDLDASTKGGLREQPKAQAIPATPGEKLPNVKGVRIIGKELLKRLGLVRRQGRVGMQGALGTYNRKSGMIRTLGAHELDVVAHEIGHAIEFTKKYPHLLAAMKKHKAFLKALDYQPDAERRHEGFAEWFRWYITNPEFAKTIDRGFTHDFESAMLTDAPEDLRTLLRAQDDYQAFLKAPSVAAARAQVMPPLGKGWMKAVMRTVKDEGPVTAARLFGEEVYRGVFDHLDPWKRAVKQLEAIYYRNTGRRLDLMAIEDPFKLLRQMPAVASAGHMDIMYGVHGYHELEPDTASLSDALNLALGEKFTRWDEEAIHDFGTYLTARRMSALYDNFNAGKLDQPPDSMSKTFWDQAAADLELANPHWPDAAQIIYDWNDALLMKRLNAGLIDRDTFNQVREDHAEYVPLFRDVSDRGQTPGSRGEDTGRAGGLIRLRGSDRVVINPIHSMMQAAYELNAAIARNDVMKALDDLGQLAGPDGGQIADRLPRKEKEGVKVDALDVLEKAAKEIGVSKADRQAVRDTLEQLFGDDAVTTVYKSVDMTPRPGENVLYVWRDGKKTPIQLPDGKWGRDMIEAFAGATPPMSGLWMELAAMPARMLRAGVTTHPTFFVANWIRDQFTAAVLTDVGYIPGVDNIRGIGAEFRRKNLARHYNLVGGEIGGMNVAAEQRARGQRDVNALRQRGFRIRHFGGSGNLFEGISRAVELSETGTRLGIFDRAERKAKRDGMDDWAAAKEAAFTSRDYMDFDRHGAWPGVRSLVRMVPFFNAALQALDKTNRVAFGGTAHILNTLFSARPPSTEAERRAAMHAVKFWTVASALAAGSLALRAAFQDDPEYQQIADYLRATHWVFPLPGSDEYMVVPKPYDLAVLSDIMERAFEGVTMHDGTAWGRLGEGLKDIWLPPFDAPIANIPLELAQNRDSFGAPIVPDHLLHTRQPADQKTDSTSSLAVGFADLMREMTGGRIDLSPAQVDYTVRSAGGTWARDALRAGDHRAPIDPAASESPFLSRFVKNWSRGAVATKEFFKYAATNDGKYSEATNSFGDLVRSAEFDEASKRLSKMKPQERAFVLLSTFEEGQNKQYHPMVRATLAVRELGQLAKDLREGDIMLDQGNGLEPLRLTPTQRRAAVDGLKKMAVAEQNNALITAGVEGWDKGRQPLPSEKYAREVEAAAPGVMQALSMRYHQNKVLPADEMHRGWAAIRGMVERQQDPTQLRAMMADKFSHGNGAKERMMKMVVEAPDPQ